jgi:CubicO group peptidase (beta-lactamase class C family)
MPMPHGRLCRSARLLAVVAMVLAVSTAAMATEPEALEIGLAIPGPDGVKEVGLDQALALLKIPSVSLALIDRGEIAFARAYGEGATPTTLYQAASLSKFVAAIGAMRLVEQGKLKLDQDVNEVLTSWHVPSNAFDATHKVTLRGLLSMTGGIGVPGFLGYAVDASIPTLTQVLDGAPPANSDPVTLVAVPGSAYHYSGGGYEIAEALMQDATAKPFAALMQELVLAPAGMADSGFTQPLPAGLQTKAASGHFADGGELPGRWHVFPELAAAGLWSTPTDLARLLLQIGRAWRGESHIFLDPEIAREMLKPQNGGPYGLGAAVAGDGAALVLMKRGQNVGYQGYLILYPATGQGLVVMTNSDNGSKLAEALVARAAAVYEWPALPKLAD